MLQNQSALHNLEDWLDYISQLHYKEMDFGLERIRSVVKPLNWHKFSCPIVIIGGTNGKGSCVKFLESIFTAAGYRVGAFTSPHLMVFNERVRVADALVSDESLIEAFSQVELNRRDISLSFFEYTFLAALSIFQKADLDLLILEVGLGGRLDAVNIVDADIAVITSIDLDHTEILGPDRESIAKEKAGIFRPGQKIVCGDPQPPEILQQQATNLGADWYSLNNEFHYRRILVMDQWRWQGPHHHYQNLPPISLKHQNAAVSLMVVELLQDKLKVTPQDLHQGLSQAFLPGRFEKIIVNQQRFYLDVAHNPHGARWLAKQWRQEPVLGKKIALLGMLADKDIAGTVQSLLHYVDSWYLASLAVPRGAGSEYLNSVLQTLGVQNCQSFTQVEHALQAAIAEAESEHDAILIFGSFYTVAAVRRYLLRRGI